MRPGDRLLLSAVAMLAMLAGCPERGGGRTEEQSQAPATAPDQRPERPSTTAVEPARPADERATVIVRLEAEPAHLNPLASADALVARVAMGDIYEGLLCLQAVDEPARPCLARAFDVSDDGAVWTFAMRPGVRWHDGTPMTSADVLYTYELLTGVPARAARGADGRADGATEDRSEPKGVVRRPLASWLAGEFDDLRRLEGVDDATVRMTFAGFRMARREAFARVPILPRHIFAGRSPADWATAEANRVPVGTGPLRYQSWVAGQEIALTRFADYWGKAAGAARIRYRIVGSRTRALRALEAGSLQVAPRLPVEEALASARAHEHLRVHAATAPSYLAAVYNTQHPLLADSSVRRALGWLMDRPSMSEALFAGHAQLIAGPHLIGDPDRDPDIAPLPYRPAAAREALQQIAGEKRALRVLVPAESRTMRRLADVWAADVRSETESLAARAVTLDIETAAYADVLGRLREGRFDIALMAFTSGLDLDLFSRFHSGEAENYGGLADEHLDQALRAVRREPDPQARRRLQRAVQMRLHQLQPYTFILSGAQVGLVHQRIGGFANVSLGARGLWSAQP